MNQVDTKKHVSTPRMRRFLKHLGNASERLREEKKIEKRKDFLQKIDNLSTAEPSVSHQELLRADSKTIESQIRKVLDIEKQIIERQKSDEKEIQKEEESLAQLRDEMSEITHSIRSTQQVEAKDTRENSERINKLNEMMEKLNERIDALSGVKTNSEQRIKEMEEKIRRTAEREAEERRRKEELMKKAEEKEKPSVFLVKAKDVPRPKAIEALDEEPDEEVKTKTELKRELKKHLRDLEKHHAKMVKAGFHSKGDLNKIKRKITSLKKKVK